jgi:hypothetical protein
MRLLVQRQVEWNDFVSAYRVAVRAALIEEAETSSRLRN